MALSNQQNTSRGDWVEYYARFGYAAKGILYGGIGLLALLEALNVSGGKTTSSTGVLRTIASQPYGQILLAVIAVSLTGYVVWRFIQAIVDPEHDGTEAKDIARRIGYACSGLVYAGVALSAIGILRSSASSSGGGGGRTEQDWALMVMQQPFGRWLVGAGGVLFFGLGCYYFYRAIKAKFRKRMKLHEMSDAEQTWATIVGRTGITARGVVYVVIGISVVRAALAFDPSAIKTTEDVLATFNQNPADEILLSILGIGFIAYGIHMGFQARYRRIEPEG
ncbi:MAG: DUF1206 domain-containing protein [Cyanobacteria bacterium J06606_4]